jgi:hypothetical protein
MDCCIDRSDWAWAAARAKPHGVACCDVSRFQPLGSCAVSAPAFLWRLVGYCWTKAGHDCQGTHVDNLPGACCSVSELQAVHRPPSGLYAYLAPHRDCAAGRSCRCVRRAAARDCDGQMPIAHGSCHAHWAVDWWLVVRTQLPCVLCALCVVRSGEHGYVRDTVSRDPRLTCCLPNFYRSGDESCVCGRDGKQPPKYKRDRLLVSQSARVSQVVSQWSRSEVVGNR